MLKRLFCLFASLILLTSCAPALAQDASAGALTWSELNAWAESYKTRALSAQPMNNPSDPEANTEDGYAFVYEFATLYMDRPEMTQDSVLRAIVITSSDELGPRDTRIDLLSSEVLAAFYNENADLMGERSFAALYLSDTMPSGAAWGWVQRDGQRIMTIQYAVHEQLTTGGDGYTDAGLVYTIQDNLVAAIRAYGLDSRINEEQVRANLDAVQQVCDETSYAQVPTSLTGKDLEKFDRDDLVFSGMDFLSLTPEEAESKMGACREDTWMQDDTGEYLRTMEFPACSMTFVYDAQKRSPYLDMMTIDMDGLEGPRAVRIGDSVSSVLSRFYYGDGIYDDKTGLETLYGTAGKAPYGLAEYGTDASATLRYALRLDDGRTVMLYLGFTEMYLSEVNLYFDN